MADPPTIIIHNLDHAKGALAAAAEAGVGVRLASAPGAAALGGAAWFVEVIAAARRAHPEAESEAVLDCGAEPGLALAAIRAGAEAIRLKARADVRRRVAAIAAAAGSRLVAAERGRSLDLLDHGDAQETVAAWLRRRNARL
ncbi:MAG: hypothetical protein R3229_06185 [Alphaproteobacteria bacterium]|nr:hypothetical protein [Alphaproteobacteria bacterium]